MSCVLRFSQYLKTGRSVFTIFMLVSGFICPMRVSAGEQNPHNRLPCQDCHLQSISGKTPLGTKKRVLSYKIAVCLKCHQPESNLHPLGIKSSSSFLPTGEKGEITCVTCHFLHAETTEYSLLRGFSGGRFKSLKSFCSECHGLEIYRKNPHQSTSKQASCSFCHFSLTGSKTSSKVRRFCRFCHSKNIHPTITSKACVDCHTTHGSKETVVYLKREFARVQPPEKNPHRDKDSCTKCHLKPPIDNKPITFLYDGNMIVLCTSCHWYKEFMHPVGVTNPKRMKLPKDLPLTEDKKITCQSCHDSCTKHNIKNPGLLRLKPTYKLRNDLCFECHIRKEYEFISPHREQFDKKKCLYCHDKDLILFSPPIAGWKKVLKTTEYLICLRCHGKSDPPGFDTHKSHTNINPAKLVVPPEFPLDNQGRITCSSCHESHFWKGNHLRGELPQDKFCLNCHLDL